MDNLYLCKGYKSIDEAAVELYRQGYRSEHVSEIIELGYDEIDAIMIGEKLGYIEIQLCALRRKNHEKKIYKKRP